MKSLLKTMLCLLLLSCLLTGCMQEEEIPGNEETDLIQAEPEEETETSPLTNILPETFSLPYAPGKTLNPITCQDGIQQVVASLLCEPLFRMTPELEAEPWLCADYTYDAETMTYTLFLREDILFSDSTPLTAADVKAALEEARTSVRYGDRLKHVTSVKTEGEHTVFITLSVPHSGFLSLLDIPIAKQGTADSVPIGTGPYLFSYTEGSAALIANQLWWQTGTQPIDRIALVETPDQDAIRYRFTSHDIQLVTADLAGTNPYTGIKNTKSQDVDTTILQYIGLNTCGVFKVHSATEVHVSFNGISFTFVKK
jgi:peptide/nickel transport system substrate-binding protein